VRSAGRFKRLVLAGAGTCLAFAAGWIVFAASAGELMAGPFGSGGCRHGCAGGPGVGISGPLLTEEPGGTWCWMRSPEEEKRVVASLYNRYCIRCHGVDGRGVWDIPDVPDFTNLRWMATRSDAQLTRAILEGRGAVMPPFRGAMSLEESWAMARYLSTFAPGTEVLRPDTGQPQQATPPKKP